jgi:hypothetical protein
VRILLALLLALQPATVIDVQKYDSIVPALQFGDVIYTAEFSPQALKPDSFVEGPQVKAEVKHGKVKVRRKDGNTVSGRLIRVQRTLIRPLPD